MQPDIPYFPSDTTARGETPPPTNTSGMTVTLLKDGRQWTYAPFEWTAVAELACNLIVEGRLKITEIAEQARVSEQTIYKWRRHPDFQERVKEFRERYAAVVMHLGITRLECRMEAMHERWIALRNVIAERALDPDLQKVAGGSTGHVVRTKGKTTRDQQGEIVETSEEYEVDTGLLAAILDLETQAARQMGQLVDKKETKFKWDGDLGKLTGEQLTQMTAILEQIGYGGDPEAIEKARIEAGVENG